ncbi:MAG: glyceraldehyde 3-phosphate dehydrogenase NAD-binding domain-containing protein [Rhizobiaceae bacterium]
MTQNRPVRIAINGFGRIGRTIARQVLSTSCKDQFELVLINDIAPLDNCTYLFRYDSVFGPYPGEVSGTAGRLNVNGDSIEFTNQHDLSSLDLSGVDVLLECTGAVKNREIAERGLKAGAANVLISGPAADADITLVLGANEEQMGQARIVSNASCTTNAIAPLVRLLDDEFGIQRGHVSTVHCYTNSQPLIDAPRLSAARSRAGALSMIPTTTSATDLVGEVLPKLNKRLTGAAIRVPVASVSAIDAVLQLSRFPEAGMGDFLETACAASPILAATEDPVVSTDLRGRPESLIVALPETMQVAEKQVRIMGWYDNEWGFSARMLDMAQLMNNRD